MIGKTYELPIKDGAINATDLGKIKDANGEVTRSYDPAYMNTVCCVSIMIDLKNKLISFAINLSLLTFLFRFPRFHTSTVIRESLNTEVTQLNNSLKNQASLKLLSC